MGYFFSRTSLKLILNPCHNPPFLLTAGANCLASRKPYRMPSAWPFIGLALHSEHVKHLILSVSSLTQGATINRQPVPTCMAAIAQLGERQTEGLKIPGSIPGLGSILKLEHIWLPVFRSEDVYLMTNQCTPVHIYVSTAEWRSG